MDPKEEDADLDDQVGFDEGNVGEPEDDASMGGSPQLPPWKKVSCLSHVVTLGLSLSTHCPLTFVAIHFSHCHCHLSLVDIIL